MPAEREREHDDEAGIQITEVDLHPHLKARMRQRGISQKKHED